MRKICLIKMTLLTLFVSILCSCHEWLEGFKYAVDMKNISTSEIYVLYGLQSKFIRQDNLTLDSALCEITKIPIGEKKPVLWVRDVNSDEFWKSTDTISLFILSKEEYEGKTWTQLVDSGQFLQVYHLSGDDIRRLGSCVPFPPTKEMCDMVMEPACQE